MQHFLGQQDEFNFFKNYMVFFVNLSLIEAIFRVLKLPGVTFTFSVEPQNAMLTKIQNILSPSRKLELRKSTCVRADANDSKSAKTLKILKKITQFVHGNIILITIKYLSTVSV